MDPRRLLRRQALAGGLGSSRTTSEPPCADGGLVRNA